MAIIPKINVIRRNNYRELRDAGFNAEQANRYKDRSQRLVKMLCDIKYNNETEVEKRILRILDKKG